MYCDTCNRHTAGMSKEAKRTVDVHKTPITVKYNAKFCEHCGAELYDENTESHIIQEAVTLFKKQQKLLLSSEILGYMNKKGISPEKLADAVECSVKEIIGASRGAIQSPETDAKLKAIIRGKRSA